MARKKFPWLYLQKKSAQELPERPPIWLGSRSNGEYFHDQTREEKLIYELTMKRADEQARRLGMPRREFLASSMGMFTTLAVINQVSGCGGDNGDGTTSMSPTDVQNMMKPGTGVPMSGGGGSSPTSSGMSGSGMPPGMSGGTPG